MASQISRAEWNHMGDRMAQLKLRLANQEQRQQAQQQRYIAQQQQSVEIAATYSPPSSQHRDRSAPPPPPLTEAPPSYYGSPHQVQRGHYGSPQRVPKSREAQRRWNTRLNRSLSDGGGIQQHESPPARRSYEEDRQASVRLPGLRENEYEFLWEHGSLGLCLIWDESLNVPVVKRLTGSGSSPSISRVEEGDILVFINTRATKDYEMDQIMDLLTRLPKPILLRFESRKKLHEIKIPSLRTGEYEILWEEGTLGIVMEESVGHIPMVKRITGNGMSRGMSKVSIGDTLVLANDRSSAKVGFHGIMAYLQDTRKPLLLRFFREQEAAAPPRDSTLSRSSSVRTSSTVASEADCYQVQWNDGPFGLTLKDLETDEGSIPAVARITGRTTCAGLRRVAVGDFLVEIGPFQTRELGFENTTKLLRNIEKPVSLKFQAHFD